MRAGPARLDGGAEPGARPRPAGRRRGERGSGRRRGQRGADSRPGERGAAVADFAMVAGLLSLLFMAALQLGIALHVRNTLIASAAEGARYGARVHSTPADGAARARQLIASSLSDRYAQHVTAVREVSGGVAVVEVRATAPLPLVGPFGPQGGLSVEAQAFAEVQ